MDKENVSEELAAEVKRYREVEGMGVRDVSEIMGLSMQDVTKIINSDVYKEVGIGEAGRPEVTVEEGIPDSGYSEERRQEILDQVYEWGLEFSETGYFDQLTDEQKRHSEFIVQSFADFMYSYYGLEPGEWHKRAPEGGLEECCTWVFPRKITAEESCFESIAPVLAAFFSFCGDKGVVKEPQSLVRRVRNIHGEIVEKASDSRNWGMAKSMLMAAKDAGVDLEDEQELNDFFESLGIQSLDQAEGRNTHWTWEEVRGLSTEQIIENLQGFGVDFDEEQFLEDVENFYSASELVDHWREKNPVTATGYDEEFIWLAATVLWERLAPDIVSSEQLNDMMQKGYDLLYGPFMEMEREQVELKDRKRVEACTIWLEVWEHLKERFTPDMKSIQDAERVFSGAQSLQNWCQDMEMELGNAGIEDPSFYEKRIEYCREFLDLFPESSDLTILNMKKAEAESYFELGNSEKGEEKYEKLTETHPNNVYGYLCWGDHYYFERKEPEFDHGKAEALYLSGLENALKQDREGDVEAALNRLSDLYEKTGEPGKIKKIEERYGIS